MAEAVAPAKIFWNEAGTPVSCEFDDVYFSNNDGLAETNYVFLQQNGLPERWLHWQKSTFVVAESGFGTGANLLALWHAFLQFRQQHPAAPLQKLHFISVEKYPLTAEALSLAHDARPAQFEYAKQLQACYPPLQAGKHLIELSDEILLELWFADVNDCLPRLEVPKSGLVDCWFLDGFAPSKNPAMWSELLFSQMARLACDGCTFATFTAAGFVRRGLLDAGFIVQKRKGFGNKREMLAGSWHAAS